jgi:hypothetical protein
VEKSPEIVFIGYIFCLESEWTLVYVSLCGHWGSLLFVFQEGLRRDWGGSQFRVAAGGERVIGLV